MRRKTRCSLNMKLGTAEEKKFVNWKMDLKNMQDTYFWSQQKNKVLKENNCQPKIVNLTKILFNKKNKMYFQIKTEILS